MNPLNGKVIALLFFSLNSSRKEGRMLLLLLFRQLPLLGLPQMTIGVQSFDNANAETDVREKRQANDEIVLLSFFCKM